MRLFSNVYVHNDICFLIRQAWEKEWMPRLTWEKKGLQFFSNIYRMLPRNSIFKSTSIRPIDLVDRRFHFRWYIIWSSHTWEFFFFFLGSLKFLLFKCRRKQKVTWVPPIVFLRPKTICWLWKPLNQVDLSKYQIGVVPELIISGRINGWNQSSMISDESRVARSLHHRVKLREDWICRFQFIPVPSLIPFSPDCIECRLHVLRTGAACQL